METLKKILEGALQGDTAPATADFARNRYNHAEAKAQALLLKVLTWLGIWLALIWIFAATALHIPLLVMGLVLPLVVVNYAVKYNMVVANIGVSFADHLPEPLKKLGVLKSFQRFVLSAIGFNALATFLAWAIPFHKNPMMFLPLLVLGVAAAGIALGVKGGARGTLLGFLSIAALVVVGIVVFSGSGEGPADTAQPPVERTQPAPKAEIPPMAPREQPRAQQPEATPSSTAPDTPEPEARHLPEPEPSLGYLSTPQFLESDMFPYSPGTREEFELEVSNHGEGTAQNVVIEVKLAEGLVFPDTGERVQEWKLGDLSPNETEDVSALVRVENSTPPGEYEVIWVVRADNHTQFHDNVETIIVG